MSIQVIKGALTWENATVQISNLADIRKYQKKYIRILTLPHSKENIKYVGRVSLVSGVIYVLHFYFHFEWAILWHSIFIITCLVSLFFYNKWKTENKNAPKEEIKYGYFVSIEKNSGVREYFESEEKEVIENLYKDISLVMHGNNNLTSIVYKTINATNIEGSTIINHSFNEAKS